MSLREIAKETGLNRRMVAKYLSGEVPVALPQPEPNGRQRPVDEAAALIDAMLRAGILNGVASSTPPTTRSCGAPGSAASSPAVTANPTAGSLR